MSVRPTARLGGLLVVTLALAPLLSACGNSGDKTTTSSTTAGSTGTTAASGTATTAGGDLTTHVAISGVPGVTDTEIRYSALGTNSNNPLGTCVLDCFVDGIQAYFNLRNAEGGIYGRKLVISKKIDDELGKNQDKAREIVAAKDTFGTFSAAQVASGWGDLAAAGIPTYVWAINPANAAGHPEIFGNREVVCIDCTQRGVPFVAKTLGAKKIATLGYGISENSKQCADFSAKSIEKYSSFIGGTTVGYTNDNLDFGLANGIGPDVTKIKNAGVDLIFICIDLNGAKTLAKELQRQGIRDKVKIFHTNTYDQQFVKEATGLFDNDVIGVGFRPFEAASGQSGLKEFHEQMAKLGKPETEMAMNGWINAVTAFEGLKGAGPSFDQKKVIDATNALKGFTAGGLIAPIDWGRQHEAPTEADPGTHGGTQDCLAMVQVKAGSFVPVGDPAKPWNCWPGNTRDWTDPVPTDFQ